MASAGSDEQRLAFGRVAELYDRARPSYPPAVLDDLVRLAGLAPGARVVEVGAGTGILTRLLAARGLAVLALEPSAQMAAVLSRSTSLALVEMRVTDFESWRPDAPFAAVVSAQAWHWVAPPVRFVRAAHALSAGGTLAAIWTFPSWDATELCGALRAAYAGAAPDLAPDFPMHPASEPTDLAGDWSGEIAACDGLFCDARVRKYAWQQAYTADEYVQLLQTHQDHILLTPDRRAVLLDAVAGVIDDAGGVLSISFVTRLCLARRA